MRKNIVANYLGQAATALLGLAFVPIYIQHLTIEAYALVGLFAMVQVWLTLLDLGMAPTLGREMARFNAGAVTIQSIRNLLRTFELICAVIAVAIVAIIASAAYYVADDWLRANALPVATVAQALVIMGFVVGIRFCEGLYRSALIGLGMQVWFNAASVALAIVRNFGALAILVYISPTIQAFFLWQGAVSLLTVAIFGMRLHGSLARSPLPARFSIDTLRNIQGFAGGMIGISLLAVLLTQVDKLLLSRLLPLDQFGYYMLAATVTATIYLVSAPVTQAVYPEFIRLIIAGDKSALSERYHTTAQLISTLLLPAVALLAAYPETILFVWSNDAGLTASAAPMVALLAIGTCCNALATLPHHLQLAHGWTGLSLKSNIIAVLVLVPVLIAAVPIYGPMAAAATWAILNIGYLLLQIPIMHRRLLTDEMWSWYVRDVGLPLAGCMIPVVLALSVRPDGAGDRLVSLAFLVFLAIAAFSGSALFAGAIRMRLFASIRSLKQDGPLR